VRQARATLVTPCWDEPYGLVVMEALACGTPVVAFRRGALPELVDEHTGILVEPGDVDGLARGAREAGALDRRDARRRAELVGSQSRMVDAYEELYDRLTPAR